MKKTLGCVVAMTLLLSLLVGCGEMGRKDGVLPTVEPTAPITSMMPDVTDGVVTDDDGIIDDQDTEHRTDEHGGNGENGMTGGTTGGMTTDDPGSSAGSVTGGAR